MNMKNNLEKVVITGGAGFIGSNLAKKLIQEGAEKILIIDDLSTCLLYTSPSPRDS